MTVSTQQTSYIKPILIQLAALAVICLLVALWQREFLAEVYLKNQLTQVGWFINGGILLLFLSGMYQLVRLFMSYGGEEQAIGQFLDKCRQRGGPRERSFGRCHYSEALPHAARPPPSPITGQP